MAPVDRVELLGLPFDRATMASAVAQCLAWCAGPRTPRTIITINASHVCQMRRDEALRRACLAGDLILADGMSVVWSLALAGLPLPERVAGVDLMARLLEEAGRHGLRVSFLGAKPEVVAALAEQSARRHPGLVVTGARDGYFTPADHPAIVEEIRRQAPHLLFVGMPSPFKETWCEANRAALDVPVVMGVGGSFDVLAGFVRRAPRLFQVAGMEWSWRLLMEPRKMWKRYLLTNSEFIWLALRQVLARRLGRPAAPASGA
ncbi:MAG: WecB/TagA/CpsF family glycosyltransferase [Anaeromyxobacter sp.]|nr:WecB/TagA/CpsF family glycosyltransferase [Anaeromyxobacter sp.]MBL0275913.1 WecB/TagA/CpsF family glycosyltransferase [Anaeromyxobacter sp.]